MSGDEIAVTAIACLLGPISWLLWWIRMRRLSRPGAAVAPLFATLLACAAALVAVLTTLAASDVVGAPAYIFMYTVLGLAWLSVAARGFAYAGLSLRDDVVERRNRASVPAACGAMVGVTAAYAGANIGNGPGWWVVLFSAGLATAVFFLLWVTLADLTLVADTVAIDRDPAAGVRLGAWLAACGLLLGRAVAGDWVSAGRTVIDAAAALPFLLPLLLVALAVEWVSRPTVERPRAPMLVLGVLPALAYVAIAIAGCVAMGWPP